MRLRMSRIIGTRPILGRYPLTTLVLAAAVGLVEGSAHVTLKAQDPGQGSKADLAGSALKVPPPATLPAARPGEYVISPEDVLDVYVYDVPELSREYTVNAAGTITVPLLPKPVDAAGLSPDQLAHSLEESFRQSGRLSRPQVTVSIKQSRRSVVDVGGAVKSPQAVPVLGPTPLLSILSQCGGAADDAGSTVTITRGGLALHDLALEGGTASPTATVEFKKLMDGNDPTSKFEVWPGDRVSVEQAGVFYVLGEVNHPGGYNLKSAHEQLSVLQALAIAGDVTSVAKRDGAKLIRKDPKAPNGRKEVALNLPDILTGRSPDRILQADDILYVPSSKGRRAVRGLGAVGSAMAGAAGAAVVYRRL
ncbi:MAG: hypothetical protein DMG21_21680 [Acidobacteria bacterium]|nr:MAG: hypothetical protein DMG21_21680 [Acidobacteriota bacterium]